MINFDLQLFLFLVAICGLAGFSLYRLNKHSASIHGELDKFESQAKTLNVTRDELYNLRNQLLAFAKNCCWHRAFASRVREILAFINGRISGID